MCQNGICVCADKRCRTWDKNGLKKYVDNLNKIYKFDNKPLVIFNHGINRFNSKSWRTCCSDYENSYRWIDKNLIQIVDDFKNFIEPEIQYELRYNAKNKQLDFTDFSNNVGFVLCGKGSRDNKFLIKELFWSLDSNNRLICQSLSHKGVIYSGIHR